MALPTLKSSYATRRNVFNEVCARKRLKEETHRNTWSDTAKYFQTQNNRTQIMNHWTSAKSFDASLNNYLSTEDREDKTSSIQSKRNKLKAIYDHDLSKQQAELNKMVEQTSNRKDISTLRKLANEIKTNKEHNRAKVAEQRIDEHFRMNDPELRAIRSSAEKDRVVQTWGDQVNDRLEREADERNAEACNVDFARQKAEQEKCMELERQRQAAEAEKQRAEELQRQIESLRQRDVNSKWLATEEEELVQQQARLDDIEAERQTIEELRRNKAHGRALLKQHNAALRKKSHEVQHEIEKDIAWLELLAQEEARAQKQHVESREERRLEAMLAVQKLRNELELEKAREAEIDQLFIQEAKEAWAKREHQWRLESMARDRLLNGVLEERRRQVHEQLIANRQRQLEELDERERLVEQLDRMRIEGDQAKHRETSEQNEQLRVDLDQQRDEQQANLRNRATQKLLDEDADRLAEAAYERKLRKEAEKIRRQANASIISGMPPRSVVRELKQNGLR